MLVNEFDPEKLKIKKFDCGDQYIYHVIYNNEMELRILLPEAWGTLVKHGEYRYLKLVNVDSDYFKIWDELSNKINDKKYIMVDYLPGCTMLNLDTTWGEPKIDFDIFSDTVNY